MLATDASKIGIGVCLNQIYTWRLKPVILLVVGFLRLKAIHTTEQELLGVLFGIQHFRVYLTGKEFELHTDHSASGGSWDSRNPKGDWPDG